MLSTTYHQKVGVIDFFFGIFEILITLGPLLLIKTGDLVLVCCSLGYFIPRKGKNDLKKDGPCIPIKSPSFWVGLIFWVGIGTYLGWYFGKE